MNYFDERRIIIEASRPKTAGELQDELRPIAPDVRIVSGANPLPPAGALLWQQKNNL